MAQIDTESTSGRVVARVRGRVFRSGSSPQGGQVSASKERRRVCVLSARGGRELEMWEIGQPCYGAGCRHTHQTREAVAQQVREGILRWVGAGKNVAAYSYGRKWVAMPSGPARAKVMQLV